MRKIIVLLLSLIFASPVFASNIYSLGSWYDINSRVTIRGISIIKERGFTDLYIINLQCDNETETCEMQTAIINNVGSTQNKIWNVKPISLAYKVTHFDQNFILATRGSEILRLYRKSKEADWTLLDNIYKIHTNQNEIEKMLSDL